jgi:hypothetical protein
MGRSFWVFDITSASFVGIGKEIRTRSTFAFPVSFTENGKVVSRPDLRSLRSRNAWFGCFPVPASVAVRNILRLSVKPNATGALRADLGENLSIGVSYIS